MTKWKVIGIVAGMESYDTNLPEPTEVSSQLAEAERLSTLAWTEAEDMPRWMYPAAGIWFAGVIASLRLMWDNPWWIVALVVLLALEGAAIGWITSMRRANPNLRSAPPEFQRVLTGYLIGLMVVVGATMALLEWSVVGGVVFCAATSTAGLVLYRAHWYRAVDATRARVSAQ